MANFYFRSTSKLIGIAAATYLTAAYLVAPLVWANYISWSGLTQHAAVTTTKQGLAADPLNFGAVGSQEELIKAMRQAGWFPADPVTLHSSLAIARSVAFNRPYIYAPISPLFYSGRKQDLAFEKPFGNSAKKRHHARLWQVMDKGVEGKPVWVGAATFDASVGLSRLTFQITHHISPEIDAERDELIADLVKAQVVHMLYQLPAEGRSLLGINGGGDKYHTDGNIHFVVVTAEAKPQNEPPQQLAQSPFVTLINRKWTFAETSGGNRTAVTKTIEAKP
jgi:LssY C-terminus